MAEMESSVNQEAEDLKQLGSDYYEASYFRGVNSSALVGIRQAGGRLLTLAHLQSRSDVLKVQQTSGTVVMGNANEVGLFWNNLNSYPFNYAHSYAAPQYDWRKYKEEGIGLAEKEADRLFIRETLEKIEKLTQADQDLVFDHFQVVLGFGREIHALHKDPMQPGINEDECCVYRDIDLATELIHLYTPHRRRALMIQILEGMLPAEAITRIRVISIEAYRILDDLKQRSSTGRYRPLAYTPESMRLPQKRIDSFSVDSKIDIDPEIIKRIRKFL